MQSDYTFLSDHSYSIILKPPEKKSRKNSNRSTNKTKSIDRNSSDKENNSGNRRKTSMKKKTATKSRQKQTNKTYSKVVTVSSKSNDAPPSLSIEERVKLRRTKPFLTPIKPKLTKKSQSKPMKKSIKPSKKLFLGSGLDLDNILLGNRQRRAVQT